MHTGRQLTEALNKVSAPSLFGVFYRSISEAAIHSLKPPEPLYSLGARRKGQRFTPKNGPSCLYLSEQFDVSFIETNGTALSIVAHGHGFTPPPTVIIAININVEHMLDLTDPVVRMALATNQDELAGPWLEQMLLKQPVPTHILARAAHRCNRFEAIRFQSMQRKGGVNVMVWPKKLRNPYCIEVHDPSHRLYQRIPPA